VALSELVAATGQESSATTLHSVSYPLGYDEGDVLVLLFTVSSGTDTATTPTDWTLTAKGAPTGGGYLYMYTRSAPVNPGGPSPIITITTSISEQSNYICLGFTDAELDSTAAQLNGTSTSITPNTYGAVSGDAIYCSFALYGDTDATPSITAFPNDHAATNIDQAQASMGLTAATSGLRASAPSSQTFTQDSSTPFRAGAFVIAESLATPSTSLSAISFAVTLTAIPSVVLESISYAVTLNATGVEPTTLERLSYAVTLETQFGATYLTNGTINTVAPQVGSESITLLPPKALTRNDTWGVLLQGDMPATKKVLFDSERHDFRGTLPGVELASDGDYIRFRYDGSAVFIEHREIA
jgi:hypothetical protein